MALFPLLADPEAYRVCETDLVTDHDARSYWLHLFESHFEVHLEAAAALGHDADVRDHARRTMREALSRVRESPALHGRLDTWVLVELRRRALAEAGIENEFRLVKSQATASALAALPARLAALDATPRADRIECLAHGALGGNLFDMGAPEMAARYAKRALAFDETLAMVPDRPWRFDDLDAVARRLERRPPSRCVLFADNAGADAVLGLLPVARFLLGLGSVVVIAANRVACLNDVTIEDLDAIVDEAAVLDEAFRSSRLRTVESGSASALIDLADVSDALAREAAGADLVILTGMGRAVESNWRTCFTCDCWRIAMIKDRKVAESVGAGLFDAVCRLDEGLV